MFLHVRHPILQSRLAAVCNLRGSVIWGQSNLNIGGPVIETVPVGAGDLDLNDFDSFSSIGSDDAHMWIGELQAGAEWSVSISQCYGGGRAFVQVLFEAQWWNLPGVTATGMLSLTSDDQIYEFLGGTSDRVEIDRTCVESLLRDETAQRREKHVFGCPAFDPSCVRRRIIPPPGRWQKSARDRCQCRSFRRARYRSPAR